MKKTNIFLAVVLCIMLAAGAYFKLGTNLKVQASAAAVQGGVRCEAALSNGSILPMECIEFIPVLPEGARITETSGEWENVPPLSSREMAFTVATDELSGTQVEIGYYVLGERRTVTVTLK